MAKFGWNKSIRNLTAMARGNRSTRRNARETVEDSGASAAGNVAADHEEAQNVETVVNVNAAVTAHATAGAVAAPIGLEAVLGMLAQVLARLPAAALAQVVPPIVNIEQVVEDVDMEARMLEETKLMGEGLRVQSGIVAGKNKKWVKNAPSDKSSASRSVCSTCGKMHVGACRAASGACHHCGSLNHKVRDCPEEDQRAKNPGKDAGERLCYNCGEAGHFKN
ncbi:unnamed protein product [Arabis nemorensis]|uniref:CCHC-type domain-containing protein n=1 Tax=Arabis nemorensis TaxID=586526 RepID=A0A565CC23_9BRAS|nr:unnamed protein product [Arabis nemorensis]